MQGAKPNSRALSRSLETSRWTPEPSGVSLHLPLQDSRWVFLKASPLHLEGPLPGCRPVQLASHCLILQPPQPGRAPGVGGPLQVEELRLREVGCLF